jgi:hypothetical protein
MVDLLHGSLSEDRSQRTETLIADCGFRIAEFIAKKHRKKVVEAASSCDRMRQKELFLEITLFL